MALRFTSTKEVFKLRAILLKIVLTIIERYYDKDTGALATNQYIIAYNPTDIEMNVIMLTTKEFG